MSEILPDAELWTERAGLIAWCWRLVGSKRGYKKVNLYQQILDARDTIRVIRK